MNSPLYPLVGVRSSSGLVFYWRNTDGVVGSIRCGSEDEARMIAGELSTNVYGYDQYVFDFNDIDARNRVVLGEIRVGPEMSLRYGVMVMVAKEFHK